MKEKGKEIPQKGGVCPSDKVFAHFCYFMFSTPFFR